MILRPRKYTILIITPMFLLFLFFIVVFMFMQLARLADTSDVAVHTQATHTLVFLGVMFLILFVRLICEIVYTLGARVTLTDEQIVFSWPLGSVKRVYISRLVDIGNPMLSFSKSRPYTLSFVERNGAMYRWVLEGSWKLDELSELVRRVKQRIDKLSTPNTR